MKDKINSREIAMDILIEILENGAYSHIVLRQALNKYQFLDKQDRALISRIVGGTLEHLLSIDAVLNQVAKPRVEKMKPLIRTLLRMSVYQLLYLDKVPDSAVCNEAVKIAVKRKFTGLKGFVNGVLRSVSREKEVLFQEKFSEEALQALALPDGVTPDELRALTLSGNTENKAYSEFLARASLTTSLPPWLLRRWIGELGWEETKCMALAFFREEPVSVRCNLSRASMEEITQSLDKQGVSWRHSPYADKVLYLSGYDYLEGLEVFLQGWVQVQDVSSVLAGEAAEINEGDFILDVCAAPGGKSLHMADRLKGTGRVEARDVSWAKTSMIEENICRCGFTNLNAVSQDARVLTPEMVKKADVVIADLPCSGLGIIGKKPDIKIKIKEESLHELAALQREILSVVWQYVKPGGVLVYSTCTINQEENYENMQWLMEHYPFTAVDITKRFVPELQTASMREGWMQFLPGKHGCDGFFVAVLKRKQMDEAQAKGMN